MAETRQTPSPKSFNEMLSRVPLCYGEKIVRPINDVNSTHKETNTKPGCQKKRIQPVARKSLIDPNAKKKPISTVKKNGGT